MADETYYLVQDGKPTGPFTLEELKEFNLRPSDFVKEAGADDYKEIREQPQLSSLLAIQYQAPLPQYYASMDVRLLAWALDFFVAFCIYCVLVVLPIIAFSPVSERIQHLLVGLLAIIPLQLVSTIYFESSRFQATIGKLIVRVKVCDTAGLPISFSKSVLRNFCKLLGFASLGLGFFIGFLNRKQQCWHDKLANTLVVKDRLV